MNRTRLTKFDTQQSKWINENEFDTSLVKIYFCCISFLHDCKKAKHQWIPLKLGCIKTLLCSRKSHCRFGRSFMSLFSNEVENKHWQESHLNSTSIDWQSSTYWNCSRMPCLPLILFVVLFTKNRICMQKGSVVPFAFVVHTVMQGMSRIWKIHTLKLNSTAFYNIDCCKSLLVANGSGGPKVGHKNMCSACTLPWIFSERSFFSFCIFRNV